ncbi:MAG: hypothetical protein JOZ92_03845, partial [Candidatus Dormibacteraeota bacterium]|nr:hypothetical protein [Candidatus Dormibacteraeota bacterium]
MIKAPERVEIPEEEELRRDRFARILAVLIVVATLGVATVEYLHSIADRSADSAGVAAQVLSIQRQGEIVRADDTARANIDIYAYAEQQRTEDANAFQEYLAPSVQQGSSEATVLQDEEARWQQLASLTDDLTPVKPGTPYSPQNDINFPTALLANAEQDSNRLFALEDANDQLRSDWQGRVGLLSVILTMLAVAIYLFGLSLTLQASIRRWLVGLGVVLVVGGLAGTAVLQLFNPTAPPDAAADAYARGMLQLETFYTQPGDQGLQAADADFTRAIQLRPRFAQAYLERSTVRFLLGSPTPTSGIASITTAAALQAQGDDLQRAHDLGLDDKLLLNNLAANRMLEAITQNRSSYYGDALGYLKSAIALDPNDPLLYYNQGLAYLGQGNTSQAHSSYVLAVQHTLYTDAAGKTPRNDPAAEETYVAGALTPLDLLAQHRSDLSSAVTSLKELIVDGVDRKGAAESSGAQVTQLALDVFPGEL